MGSIGMKLNTELIVQLQKNIATLPKGTKFEINSYLWNDGAKMLENEIYMRMPKSKEAVKHKSKVYSPHHARNNKSLERVPFDYGIKIQTKTTPKSSNFGYLIFPEEGRGIRQRKKGSQEFFAKSLDAKQDKIINGLIIRLENKIEEVL